MKNKKRRYVLNKLFFFGLVLVVFLDWFLQGLSYLKNFGIENRGISFGIAQEMGSHLQFLLPALVFIIFIFFWKNSLYNNLFLVVMIMGGIGNLVPRVLFGYVWDYILVFNTGLWVNLSDLLISAGALSYILVGDDRDTNTMRNSRLPGGK